MSEQDHAHASDGRPLVPEDYPYLSVEEWTVVGKLYRVLGGVNTHQLLQQPPEKVREHLSSFRQYETELVQQVSTQVASKIATEPTVMERMVQRVVQSIPTPPAPVVQVQMPASPRVSSGPKPLKIAVKPFCGKQGENLHFWFRQVDMALEAALVQTEQQKVAFAFSHLQGAAHEWAFTWEINDPGYFSSWKFLQEAMAKMFLPPNAAFKHRATFLNCRQGKRSIYEFVQELRKLRASLSDNPIPEDVMVTVFMEGLEFGPPKTEVFRRQPTELEEAIYVALQEDQLQRQSRGLPTGPTDVHTPSGGGPEPMDLSAIDRLQVNCFRCGRIGHFERDCHAKTWGSDSPNYPASGFAPRGRGGWRGGRHGGRARGGRGGRGTPTSVNNVEVVPPTGGVTAPAGNAPA